MKVTNKCDMYRELCNKSSYVKYIKQTIIHSHRTFVQYISTCGHRLHIECFIYINISSMSLTVWQLIFQSHNIS